MSVTILTGDCRAVLSTLEECSVHCCVTSPPYFGLRDYGVEGQIGLETTPDAYVAEMVTVFREVRRVLRDDGTLWLVIGDSYNAAGRTGHGTRLGDKQNTNRASASGSDACRANAPGLKEKDLIGIPWRVAFALQADGWYLRSDVIWHKSNPMPESVGDRPTSAHEHVFMLTKSPRYYFDSDAVKEQGSSNPATSARNIRSDRGIVGVSALRGHVTGKSGNGGFDRTTGFRNIRNVWTVPTQPYEGAHFATFPPRLVEPCIKASCPAGGTVIDPFGGSGTVGLVARRLNRQAILVELNPDYVGLIRRRLEIPDDDASPCEDSCEGLFEDED